MEQKEYKLAHNYILWFHKINDKNWNFDSYIKVKKIGTICDFWSAYSKISTYNSGMFFLMKEGITPLWEDPKNINGGYWSFKIFKTQSDEIWNNLSMALIGGTLTKYNENMKYITGISISPKINNSIIKIWNNDSNASDHNILNNISKLVASKSIYKKHQEHKNLKK